MDYFVGILKSKSPSFETIKVTPDTFISKYAEVKDIYKVVGIGVNLEENMIEIYYVG